MSQALDHWARENRRSIRRAYELLVSFGLGSDLVKRSLLPRAVIAAQSDFDGRLRGRWYTARRGGRPWTG